MRTLDIDVTRVSESKWWVGDNRLPESDPASLIGVIRRKEDGFESVRFAHHDEVVRFHSATMTDAIEYFSLTDDAKPNSPHKAWKFHPPVPD